MKKYISLTVICYLMLTVASAQYKYYGADKQPETHSIGIMGGMGGIMGDLSNNSGFQGGAYYQYRFARWLDARVAINYGKYTGLGTIPTPIIPNNALNGERDPSLNYSDTTNYGVFYPNYQMTSLDISISAKLHFIEMFSKNYNEPVSVYLIGGVGAFSYITKMNARNVDNSQYSFKDITGTTPAQIKSQVKSMLDKTYETDAEYNKTSTISPYILFGGGVRYRLGQHLGLGFELLGKYNSDDLLDGFQWKNNTQLTNNKDLLGAGNLCVEWIF